MAHPYKTGQDWLAKHPQWGGIIVNSTVGEEYVRSRLDFCWQMFQVQAPRNVSPNHAEDDLHKDIMHLGDNIAKLIIR